LDETGCCLALPTTYYWRPKQQPLGVPKSKGSDDQVNVLGTLCEYQGQQTLEYRLFEGTCCSAVFIAYLDTLAAQSTPEIPTIVVLDNASFHRSAGVKARIAWWQEQGLYLFYLPPYASRLNPLERVWWALKYSLQPRRRYRDVADLWVGVEEGLQTMEAIAV
jgi:transposase